MPRKKRAAGFYCGTSNIVLPVPNKDHFPEAFKDKSRLHYYASLFPSVEINSTFYKIPMPRTVERWAQEVPADFRFTFKLWRGITHEKELSYSIGDIERFADAVRMAGDKCGALLVQFPGSVKASRLRQVRQLLNDLQLTASLKKFDIAVEFRDAGWYAEPVYAVLEDLNVGIVIHDKPQSATPYIEQDVPFRYLRFHGPSGDYRGRYTEEELEDHSLSVSHWLSEGRRVYAYFNNTIGDAFGNAEYMKGVAEQ
ncbi:MAG: DUF72 domain-containing protein [Flavipsychrobacter sp.]|nr:DUF72 domain-containing protein [Flavipsychrobacter sp.]